VSIVAEHVGGTQVAVVRCEARPRRGDASEAACSKHRKDGLAQRVGERSEWASAESGRAQRVGEAESWGAQRVGEHSEWVGAASGQAQHAGERSERASAASVRAQRACKRSERVRAAGERAQRERVSEHAGEHVLCVVEAAVMCGCILFVHVFSLLMKQYVWSLSKSILNLGPNLLTSC